MGKTCCCFRNLTALFIVDLMHLCYVLSHFSHVWLYVAPWTVRSLPGSSVHGILQARIPGVGCCLLLQGLFLTQGSNPDIDLMSTCIGRHSLPWESPVHLWYWSILLNYTATIIRIKIHYFSHNSFYISLRWNISMPSDIFSSVQSLSRVRLYATPWIAASQDSLSITDSRSSLRLTSIKSVMPSSHLILCCPLLLLPPVGQSTGVSALASFLPKKSQGWSPSEWTGWISLQSKGLSRVFSNTTHFRCH